MSNLIEFADLTVGNRAVKKVTQAFTRAGAPVATIDMDGKTKRSSGVSFRSLFMTFVDGQKVEMQVKKDGTVFAVKINGSIRPMKEQDDHRKAVAELVKYLEAGRKKHQQKLARIKTRLPKGIKTAAPKMEVALKSKMGQLDSEIAAARTTVNTLREELGEPALDSVELALDEVEADASKDAKLKAPAVVSSQSSMPKKAYHEFTVGVGSDGELSNSDEAPVTPELLDGAECDDEEKSKSSEEQTATA